MSPEGLTSAEADYRRRLAHAQGLEAAQLRARLASLLHLQGRCAEATRVFRASVERVPPHGRWYYRAARAAYGAGEYGLAARWIGLAGTFGCRGPGFQEWKGRIHLAASQPGPALHALRAALRDWPDDAELRELLGVALLRNNSPGQALAELEQAVALRPESPQARLALAEALQALNHPARAREVLEGLLRDHPGLSEAKERLAEVLLALDEGERAEAVAADDPGLRQRLALRRSKADSRRAEVAQMLALPVPEAFRLQAPPREDGRLWLALRRQGRVVAALLLRETRTRFGRHRLGYLWALAEPALHVAVFMVLFSTLRTHEVAGMSIPLFIVTGLLPFLMFLHSYNKIVGGVRSNAQLLYHPRVKVPDILLARAVLEFCTVAVVFVIFLAGLRLAGDPVAVARPLEVIAAMAVMWLAGVALGLTVNSFAAFFPALPILMSVVTRLLYFTSGVFFSMSMLPVAVRDVLLWNPLMHLVELVRENFNPLLQVHQVNWAYPLAVILPLLLFGLLVDRAFRQQVLQA